MTKRTERREGHAATLQIRSPATGKGGGESRKMERHYPRRVSKRRSEKSPMPFGKKEYYLRKILIIKKNPSMRNEKN